MRGRSEARWGHPPRMSPWYGLHRCSLYSLVSPSGVPVYADNLKCTSKSVDSVVAAAQYTVSYVHAVGQEASPSKCVLLSTSKAARRRMTAWRNEHEGCFWAVKLDRWSFGCHLASCSWYFE